MISGWAGIGINDNPIDATVPRVKLYYRAGGFPLDYITHSEVPFPTRSLADNQAIGMDQGVNTESGLYGWEIYFQRDQAFGSAYVELDIQQLIPLEIEGCPHVTKASSEEAEGVPVTETEPVNPAITFITEPECVGLAVTEEP